MLYLGHGLQTRRMSLPVIHAVVSADNREGAIASSSAIVNSSTASVLAAGIQAWSGPLDLPLDEKTEAALDDIRKLQKPDNKADFDSEAMALSNLVLGESLALDRIEKMKSSWTQSRVQLPAGLGLCQSRENLRQVVEKLVKKNVAIDDLDQARVGYRSMPTTMPLKIDKSLDTQVKEFVNDKNDEGIPKKFNLQGCLLKSYRVIDDELEKLIEDTTTNTTGKASFRLMASKGQNELLKFSKESKPAFSKLAKAVRKHKTAITYGKPFETPHDALLRMALESSFIEKKKLPPLVPCSEYAKAMDAVTSVTDSLIGSVPSKDEVAGLNIRQAFKRFKNMTSILAGHASDSN